MSRKSYEIGDHKYWQDELVLIQEEALAELLGPLYETRETGEEMEAAEIVQLLLKEKVLRQALAIVLVPEGQTLADRDVEAVEQHLAENMTLSQQAAVIKDFFDCNGKVAAELQALSPAPVKLKRQGKAKAH